MICHREVVQLTDQLEIGQVVLQVDDWGYYEESDWHDELLRGQARHQSIYDRDPDDKADKQEDAHKDEHDELEYQLLLFMVVLFLSFYPPRGQVCKHEVKQ